MENQFKKIGEDSVIEVRQGSRAPWLEMRVTKKDGKVLKYIFKAVDQFYSERQGTVIDLE